MMMRLDVNVYYDTMDNDLCLKEVMDLIKGLWVIVVGVDESVIRIHQ
jgi:hypothetical protein